MRRRTTATAAVLSVLVLAGCGGETGLDPDLGDTIDVPDTIEVPDAIDVPDLSDVEAELDRMRDEVDASAVQEDLASAWASVEAELRAAVESIRSGAAVDAAAIEQQFDEFQDAIDIAEVESTLQETWARLRARFDSLMANGL